MVWLVTGLVIFLGVHSVRIFAEDWRKRTLAEVGEKRFKAIYSLVSLVGFVLLVWGFGVARQSPVQLWNPPVAMRHIAGLLVLLAFVCLAAAFSPPNAIKARLGHPMLVSVKTWALAHLLSNGTLADMVLFGAFLAWAVLAFVKARKRDRADGTIYPTGTTRGTAIAVLGGVVGWAVFAFFLHGLLIGVRPMC